MMAVKPEERGSPEILIAKLEKLYLPKSSV